MEFTDYFDNINENTLNILESQFVSRLSSTAFFLLEHYTKRNYEKLDPFVLERSRSITLEYMKKAKMHLHPPYILLYQEYRQRSKSVRTYYDAKYKTEHSLQFMDFIYTMNQLLKIPFKVSTNFFAKICKPRPLTSHEKYNELISLETDFFSVDVATSVFATCQIYWVDLLNYLCTKTTFVQPISEVKLIPKRVPNTFAHRLAIENLQMIPSLGVYFSSSRDGLAQMWSSEIPSRKLRFKYVDEMGFGMDEADVKELVAGVLDTSNNKTISRSQRIDVLYRLVNGEISLNKVKNSRKVIYFFNPLPFYLVWSFTNPDTDKSVSHIMSKDATDAGGVTRIIKACRAADAPLPSGRPLPERIDRTINFNGGVYLSYSYAPKDEKKYVVIKRKFRSKSVGNAQIKLEVGAPNDKVALNKLFNEGFTTDEIPAHEDFQGKQHPIFLMKKKEKYYGFRRSLTAQRKSMTKDVLNAPIYKKETSQYDGHAWAAGMCVIDNQIIVSTLNCKLLFYVIKYKGIELTSFIEVSGIGITYLEYWNRTLNAFDIYNHKVIGCSYDELPSAGEKEKMYNCVVYCSPNVVSVIKVSTRYAIVEIRPYHIFGHKNIDKLTEKSEDEYPATYELPTFCKIVCYGQIFFIGMSDGTLVKVNPVSFEIDFIRKIFNAEISSLAYEPSLHYLIAGSLSSYVKIYQLDLKMYKLQSLRESGCVIGIFTSIRYYCIITCCSNGVVTVWNLKQFNYLFKTFVNEYVTVSCWDEESALLIVGYVQMKALKLIGAKNEEAEEHAVEKQLPQAHFIPAVSVIYLEPKKDCCEDVSDSENSKEDVIDYQEQSQILTKYIQSPIVELLPNDSEGEKEELKIIYQQTIPSGQPSGYKRPQFIRYLDKLVNFPDYNAPSSMGVTSASVNYSKIHHRVYFADEIRYYKFTMMDFSSYLERVEVDYGKYRSINDRKSGASKITGIDIIQMVKTGTGYNKKPFANISGYVTIDYDANIRHWSKDNKILATHKIEVPDDHKVISGFYDSDTQNLCLNLYNGDSIFFEMFTYYVSNYINVANCARAAYLLKFYGYTVEYNSYSYTSEFYAYLKKYNPKRFAHIACSCCFYQSIAYGCGNLILIFDYGSYYLSKRFVYYLLAYNSKEALELANGITQPPSLVLSGHSSNVISIDSCGRKFLSADESGVVCCWMGYGIAKAITQVKQDIISKIVVLKHKYYWGLIFLKCGTILSLNKQLYYQFILKLHKDNVAESLIATYENKNDVLIAISDIDKMIIVKLNLNTSAFNVYGYYKPYCYCKNLTAIGFVNNGQSINVNDIGGHSYNISISELQSAKQQNFDMNADELRIVRSLESLEAFYKISDMKQSLTEEIREIEEYKNNEQIDFEMYDYKRRKLYLKIEKALALNINDDVENVVRCIDEIDNVEFKYLEEEMVMPDFFATPEYKVYWEMRRKYEKNEHWQAATQKWFSNYHRLDKKMNKEDVRHQAAALSKEIKEMQKDSIQYLYHYNPTKHRIQLNPFFDPRFDSATLLKGVPLSTSIIDIKQEDEQKINEKTQMFFRSLQEIELKSLDDEIENLGVRVKNPVWMKISAKYVIEEQYRIYLIEYSMSHKK